MTTTPAPDYRRLFEATPDPYLALRPDLVIVAVSDGFLRTTMTRREEIIGRPILEVFPDNPHDPLVHATRTLQESMDRVRAARMTDCIPALQFDIRRPMSLGDGFEERYWRITNTPVLDEKGEIIYILNHPEDVTQFFLLKKDSTEKDILLEKTRLHTRTIEAEVYRQAQQIAAANRELEQANADLETFSYSVSHDLKTPLRAIDGFARMLSERATQRLDDEDQRLLGIIQNSSKSMAQLIDDLLSFSRAGRHSLRRRRINMMKMAEAAWREVGNDYKGQISISDLPDAVGDAALIHQVWLNLLGNAVKYTMNNANARIVISGSSNAADSLYHISDNGIGFDMRHLDKLFSVFQRLQNAGGYPGTGIGLAIVKRIVSRHGGEVRAEGQTGKGASFHFSLPREAPPQE
jgi:signal transduction histidine kinase